LTYKGGRQGPTCNLPSERKDGWGGNWGGGGENGLRRIKVWGQKRGLPHLRKIVRRQKKKKSPSKREGGGDRQTIQLYTKNGPGGEMWGKGKFGQMPGISLKERKKKQWEGRE